jgi:serine phosphatase RsbU (regulator of sigma subunit)
VGNQQESKIKKEFKQLDVMEQLPAEYIAKYDYNIQQLTKKNHKNAIVIGFIAIIFALSITYSKAGNVISERISSPIEFNVRHWLHRDAAISPDLKILLFDDKVAAKLGRPAFTLKEWYEVISYISSHHPKRIYIDRIFGIGFGSTKEDKEAIASLEKIKTPISVGSFISDSKINFRKALREDYSSVLLNQDITEEDLGILPDIKKLKSFVYGPTEEVHKIFTVGHIYYDSERYFSPGFKTNERSILVHLGLMDQNISFKNSQMLVNDKNIHLQNGRIPINFGKYPEDFFKASRSLMGILNRLSADQRWDEYLTKDSHILILPEAFTGTADFKRGPFGSMLGGWVIGSVLNSGLTGAWLREINSSMIIISSMVFVGLISSLLRTWICWLVIVLVMLLGPALGLSLFAYKSTIIPWFPMTVFSVGFGIIVLATRSRLEKTRDNMIAEMLTETNFITRENILLDQSHKILIQEKKEATAIAKAFRPDTLPTWDQFDISGFHNCFDAASGDWYFFEKSSDNQLFHVVMCDITGHGVQAALVVSTCKTVLNSFKKYQIDGIDRPDFCLQYLEALNEILFKQGQGQHCCSFIGVTFEPNVSKLHLVSCAHPPAIYHNQANLHEKPVFLKTKYDPLGFKKTVDAKLATYDWKEGDQLIIHTDGIPLTDHTRYYREFITSYADSWENLAREMYKKIWERIEEKTGKRPDDDVSLLVIRHKSQN